MSPAISSNGNSSGGYYSGEYYCQASGNGYGYPFWRTPPNGDSNHYSNDCSCERYFTGKGYYSGNGYSSGNGACRYGPAGKASSGNGYLFSSGDYPFSASDHSGDYYLSGNYSNDCLGEYQSDGNDSPAGKGYSSGNGRLSPYI